MRRSDRGLSRLGGLLLGTLPLTAVLLIPLPTLAATSATIEEAPQLITAEPFLVHVSTAGLLPLTNYEMTARLRRTDSTSDQGSFAVVGSFGTAYQSVEMSDIAGKVAAWVWVKPGSATSYSAIRLRFRVVGTTATPSPIDVPFARQIVDASTLGTVTGTASDVSFNPVSGAFVRVFDQLGSQVLVSRTEDDLVKQSDANPVAGVYKLSLSPGLFTEVITDAAGVEIGRSAFTVAAGQTTAVDINPKPLPPPKIYSNDVRLSELLPDPVGSDDAEFVELENTGSEPIDLTAWTLVDASGKKFQLSGVIQPGFLFVGFTQSKLTLNNAGDSIALADPNGLVHDAETYTGATEGQSWARDGESWRWSLLPTPGAANLFPLPPEPLLLSITEARQHQLGEVMRTSGVVTVSSEVLGSHIAYIQGATGGLQVYSTSEQLTQGEVVELTGALSSYHQEKRLKITQIKRLGPATLPQSIELTGLAEVNEGMLATIRGKISKLDGQTFVLTTEAGKVKVVIHDSTGIKRPAMHSGEVWQVTGIVSQYSNDDADSGYRLLPFSLDQFLLVNGLPPKVAEATVKPAVSIQPTVSEAATIVPMSPLLRLSMKTERPFRIFGAMILLLGMVNVGFLFRR